MKKSKTLLGLTTHKHSQAEDESGLKYFGGWFIHLLANIEEICNWLSQKPWYSACLKMVKIPVITVGK